MAVRGQIDCDTLFEKFRSCELSYRHDPAIKASPHIAVSPPIKNSRSVGVAVRFVPVAYSDDHIGAAM